MSYLAKMLVISLSFVTLASCGSGSSSSTPIPKVGDNNKTCVPESQLLSKGIVGGQKVTEQDNDSKKVVMLYSDGELCTASAIAPDVLLTAAHCVNGDADGARVFTHTSVSCESGFDSRQDTIYVAAMVVNEAYNKKDSVGSMSGDVALIFLKDNLPAGYPIYKIANPDLVSDSNEIYFYGYGVTGYEQSGSGILRKTQFPRTNFSILKDEKKVKIDQSHGSGICSGDSGGPGLIYSEGELEILGVNSYVRGDGVNKDLCQNESYLSLANSYRSWMEDQMALRGRNLRK